MVKGDAVLKMGNFIRHGVGGVLTVSVGCCGYSNVVEGFKWHVASA